MDLIDYRRKIIANSPHLMSASGAVVSFSDGADNLPLKSLNVGIEPVQSGSGDPSPTNIRPISGWNAVNVKNGNTVIATISLGQTVYGGTLNVLTGVLTVDRANISITDYLTSIQNNGARNGNQLIALAITGKKAGTDNFISNLFFISSSAVGKYTMHGRATSTTIEFEIPFSALGVTEEDPVNVRLSAAKQWFTDNPTQLCYELATPFEIQLIPHQIRSLYGNNTIFADTGNVALEYWAHP